MLQNGQTYEKVFYGEVSIHHEESDVDKCQRSSSQS